MLRNFSEMRLLLAWVRQTNFLELSRGLTKTIGLLMMFVFIPQASIASGSYSPLGAPNGRSQYTQGKIIFHKFKNEQTFNHCVSCYTDQGSLDNNCAALQQCVSENVGTAQLAALEYFLKKRYRLE